ncbi:hypothetical protein ACFP1Z_27375 [Streptomyces gamaensis]|uniref:Integral membrane protein n=1 Tax=Streptomyces gamaensis TaxID=1763542 RepID=A0ABW0Z7S6_9ACTN
MSFGDQNNPYGQPQQPAPGYGYPQQGAAPGQPYAPYPQAQAGYHAPYGAPLAPLEMPGSAKTARVMLYVIAGLHVIIAGLCFSMVAVFKKAAEETNGETFTNRNGETVDADTIFNTSKGVVGFLAVLALVFAVLGIVLAVRYAKGGNGVRIGSIVYASFGIISGFATVAVFGLGLATLVLSILVIVFAAKQPTTQWFRRPRH